MCFIEHVSTFLQNRIKLHHWAFKKCLYDRKVFHHVCVEQVSTCLQDGGSPDARLRFARLTLARLRLNDGAKLWDSFKLCFKTNDFLSKWGNIHHFCFLQKWSCFKILCKLLLVLSSDVTLPPLINRWR